MSWVLIFLGLFVSCNIVWWIYFDAQGHCLDAPLLLNFSWPTLSLDTSSRWWTVSQALKRWRKPKSWCSFHHAFHLLWRFGEKAVLFFGNTRSTSILPEQFSFVSSVHKTMSSHHHWRCTANFRCSSFLCSILSWKLTSLNQNVCQFLWCLRVICLQ